MSADLDDVCKTGADEAFDDLDLVDLNVILHRADGEERDATGMSNRDDYMSADTDVKKVMEHILFPTTVHWFIAVWRDG